MKAWYFSANDRKLRYDDNRIIKAGITHKVTGYPILCERGLHGSVKILDALQYAPGDVVWRVELSGDMDIGNDKIAATERKYLWGYDAEDVLRNFARLCALDVIHLWDAPDVVVRYLKTGDENIRSAAWAATWVVSARDAAWAASARDAAWAASARDAAWASVRDAAWEKQNKRLYQMILNGRGKA